MARKTATHPQVLLSRKIRKLQRRAYSSTLVLRKSCKFITLLTQISTKNHFVSLLAGYKSHELNWAPEFAALHAPQT